MNSENVAVVAFVVAAFQGFGNTGVIALLALAAILFIAEFTER